MTSQQTIHLISFNIRLGLDSSIDAIADWLASQNADIIALQEVGKHWIMGDGSDQSARIASRLGLHARYIPAIFENVGAAQYGIALFSRYPFGATRRVNLPQLDDEPRVLFAAEIAAPRPFWVFTTHLSIKPRDRSAQLLLTADLIAAQQAPALLLGDLNTTPDTEEFRSLLTRTGLHDCQSDNLPTYPTRAPRERLDHILASVAFAAHVPVSRQLADLSDHVPVQGVLAILQGERCSAHTPSEACCATNTQG